MDDLKCEDSNFQCSSKKRVMIVFLMGLLIGGGLVFSFLNNKTNNVALEETISIEEAEEKVLNTINEYMLPPEMAASLVASVIEKGLYKITVDVQEQEVYVYLSKDGTLFFPEAIDLDIFKEQIQQEQTQQEQTQQEQIQGKFTQEELTHLAKQLREKGIMFFGTYNCPFCVQQKEMFGEVARYLPYIECSPEKATEEELEKCLKMEVGAVPDWRFPGKEPIIGMLSIEKLIEYSDCELLKDRI